VKKALENNTKKRGIILGFVFCVQFILCLLYIWFALFAILISNALRELQRDPVPGVTPVQCLVENNYFFIIVLLMIALLIFLTKKRLKIRSIPIINIVLAGLVITLNFMPSSTLLSMRNELEYWSYIAINESVLMLFNVFLVIFSKNYLRRIAADQGT